jgi:hypothetical protein
MSKGELKEKFVSEFKRDLIDLEKRFKEIDQPRGKSRESLGK